MVGDTNSDARISVAYTVEQCWHPVPGGTAVAALRVARELSTNDELSSQVDLRLVAGKHPLAPRDLYVPPGPVAMLPLGRRMLYEGWTRLNWPKVEAVTGLVDVVHATGLIPAGTDAPLVVTVHDIAFVHTPESFTRRGAGLMTRSLRATRKRAQRVICSSQATLDDLVEHGFDPDVLRLVPLGVDTTRASESEIADAAERHGLPDEYVLFVGTLEPRKNLARLVEALKTLRSDGFDLPLVVVGVDGWGSVRDGLDVDGLDIRFLGEVSGADLRALFASAAVMAYPSEREGFGLPVVEAMAQGAAVVTSRGTSTEEVAGGAAVLVDPFDVADIARGVAEAYERREQLAEPGRQRAASMSWGVVARATLAVYREAAS